MLQRKQLAGTGICCTNSCMKHETIWTMQKQHMYTVQFLQHGNWLQRTQSTLDTVYSTRPYVGGCPLLNITPSVLCNYHCCTQWPFMYTMTFVVHNNLWMMPRWRSGVWRRGRNPLLPGDNVCCRHVHHRCCGNRSGKGTHYTVYSNTPMINLSYT